MGMENLFFNGLGFQIVLFTAQNPVGTPEILVFSPVGMRVQCSFPLVVLSGILQPKLTKTR